MRRLLKEMTEPELQSYFRMLAEFVEDMLPAGPSAHGKCFFFLIVAEECGAGISQYVSNAQRTGAIELLRETADRLERNQDVTR